MPIFPLAERISFYILLACFFYCLRVKVVNSRSVNNGDTPIIGDNKFGQDCLQPVIRHLSQRVANTLPSLLWA